MSDVCPGREKGYLRFPTPPPPFSDFDGKAVSVHPPALCKSPLRVPPGSPARRQVHILSNANSSQHWNVHLAKPRLPQTPKSLSKTCSFCMPPGEISSQISDIKHKVALQGRTSEPPVAAWNLLVTCHLIPKAHFPDPTFPKARGLQTQHHRLKDCLLSDKLEMPLSTSPPSNVAKYLSDQLSFLLLQISKAVKTECQQFPNHLEKPPQTSSAEANITPPPQGLFLLTASSPSVWPHLAFPRVSGHLDTGAAWEGQPGWSLLFSLEEPCPAFLYW